MKKATFYVDHCFVAGGEEIDCHLSGRYRFDLSLSDEEYEELCMRYGITMGKS